MDRSDGVTAASAPDQRQEDALQGRGQVGPEAAGQRVGAAAVRARVRLSGRTGQRVSLAAARAAADPHIWYIKTQIEKFEKQGKKRD